jgi:hypothetical protein
MILWRILARIFRKQLDEMPVEYVCGTPSIEESSKLWKRAPLDSEIEWEDYEAAANSLVDHLGKRYTVDCDGIFMCVVISSEIGHSTLNFARPNCSQKISLNICSCGYENTKRVRGASSFPRIWTMRRLQWSILTLSVWVPNTTSTPMKPI